MLDANIYSEVYEILSYMDKSTVMKIPLDILEYIKNNRNKDYISKIDPEDIFNPNNIDEKSLELLACIDVNYWMDKGKRAKLELKYRQNMQNQLKKEDKIYEMFDMNQVRENSESISEKNSLIKNKESFLEKVFNKLKKLLKKDN